MVSKNHEAAGARAVLCKLLLRKLGTKLGERQVGDIWDGRDTATTWSGVDARVMLAEVGGGQYRDFEKC